MLPRVYMYLMTSLAKKPMYALFLYRRTAPAISEFNACTEQQENQ